MARPITGLLRAASLVALLGVAPAVAAPPAPDPDCQCRDPSGQRRDLGTVECVEIAGRRWLVRCEMSTNTPYWRRVRDDAGCPLASASGGSGVPAAALAAARRR